MKKICKVSYYRHCSIIFFFIINIIFSLGLYFIIRGKLTFDAKTNYWSLLLGQLGLNLNMHKNMNLYKANGYRIRGYCEGFSQTLIKCFSQLANIMFLPFFPLLTKPPLTYERTYCHNIHLLYIHWAYTKIYIHLRTIWVNPTIDTAFKPHPQGKGTQRK